MPSDSSNRTICQKMNTRNSDLEVVRSSKNLDTKILPASRNSVDELRSARAIIRQSSRENLAIKQADAKKALEPTKQEPLISARVAQ